MRGGMTVCWFSWSYKGYFCRSAPFTFQPHNWGFSVRDVIHITFHFDECSRARIWLRWLLWGRPRCTRLHTPCCLVSISATELRLWTRRRYHVLYTERVKHGCSLHDVTRRFVRRHCEARSLLSPAPWQRLTPPNSSTDIKTGRGGGWSQLKAAWW